MLNRLRPFFRLDERMDWGILEDSAPVNDDQPVEESETESEETEEEATETSEENESDESQEDESEETEEETDEEDDSADESDQTLDDETEIDLGEGRQPMKLGELKQGYLRQSDYTKKTQQLADERKEFEAKQEEMKPVSDLHNFFNSNPYVYDQVVRAVQEFNQTGNFDLQSLVADPEYGQAINQLLAERNSLKKELQDVQGKYGEMEFNSNMNALESDLKASYGDLVTQEYMDGLKDRSKEQNLSHDVIKEIAEGQLSKKQLEQEQKKAKKAAKEAETKTYQKLREKSESLPSQPKRKGQKPNTEPQTDPFKPMEWDEIL